MRLLVTGFNGFIGSTLGARLRQRGDQVIGVVRQGVQSGCLALGDIGPDTHWSAALAGCDAVVHLAARVHRMGETGAQAAAAYQRTNVDATLRLAEQAAAVGVRRLIYLSTVKVHGEETGGAGQPQRFSVRDPAQPTDAYAQSKWQAEQALRALAERSGLEVVVIRPPLVYGPGVKGNMQRLLGWSRRGWPLPLGAVDNRRSLLALDNLVDLILRCLDHPAAAGATLLAADGEDLSTADLVRRLGRLQGRSPVLLPVPPVVLQGLAGLLGKGEAVRRLTRSLRVDDSHTRALLDWQPPLHLEAGLRRMLGDSAV